MVVPARRCHVRCTRAVLQELHRACEAASRGGHIPGGPALAWARGYAAAVASEQSCLNEWLAMADLESVRPASPPPCRYAPPHLPPAANQMPAWVGVGQGGARGWGLGRGGAKGNRWDWGTGIGLMGMGGAAGDGVELVGMGREKELGWH